MKTFLQTLLSQVPGIALGITGGVALTFATLESRVERMLDAQTRQLRGLAQPCPAPTSGVTWTQDSREELRLIREQLAVLAAREPVAAPPAQPAEPARPAPTPGQWEASRQGQQVLDDAIARGRWTDDDQRRFHQALGAGPREEVEAMERELSLAINSGQLRPVLGEER
ncbi:MULTISPECIES: hypothetical protein [unclassified Corallococcus]|uniref:hypothetical protein n=1 Tax=unclassified Corallococcus TaxID=2685029 RepID=UPI001A8CBD56|nr:MULTISPECIES: hypothetical protein [unclassified Corallococcus]MBN9688401.1 hypothetical protein [Corallococcus sp. NCSPR001]WAS87799.1 hypothetical protein O0N60_12655 [Corallococcus sp. NCRR]